MLTYLDLTSMRNLFPVKVLMALSLAALMPATAICVAQASNAPHQLDRVLDSADAASTRLPGHIPAWATASADAGAVPASAQVRLTIGISRAPEVQAAFDQRVIDQQNPSSPRYHRWLLPAQIGAEFGPTQHDLDAVTSWLTANGLRVETIQPSRTFIEVTAPASSVNNAFRTTLHSFALPARGNIAARQLQAPTAEPSIPARLSQVISFVGGLADMDLHVNHYRLPNSPLATSGILPEGVSINGSVVGLKPDYTLSNGAVHYIAPADFTTIYNLSPVYNSAITGANQKIMVLGGSRLTPTDLTKWETLSALPAYQPNYIVPSTLTDPGTTGDGKGGAGDGDQGEATLDFNRAYATAYGATIDMVVAANWLGSGFSTLLNYAIQTVNDPILTVSIGGGEYGNSVASVKQIDNTFQGAAAQGITTFFSSGDSGVAGGEAHGGTAVPTQIATINVFCATGYVTCVGGTQFSDTANPGAYWASTNGTGKSSALSYIPEGAWNEPYGRTAGTYVVASTGGGPSAVITKPSWQVGVGVPADGFRDTPDVSFSASGHNAYFSCLGFSGADCVTTISGFGGTSASAPSMAGIAALINQKLGARQGNLNPLLYKIAASSPSAFHDATPATSGVNPCDLGTPSTCNNSNASPTTLTGGIQGFALTTGYDFPTGLGSMDVAKFIAVASLPISTTVVTAAPATATISQNVTLTATVSGASGTPTGTVQFASNGIALDTPIALVNGVATQGASKFSPAGTFVITANYSGDSAFGPSTGTYSLVITNPNAIASNSMLTVTPSSATTLQTVTLTDMVTGANSTPTGTVQFTVDGTNRGTPVTILGKAYRVASLPGLSLAAGPHSVVATYSGDSIYAASTSNTVNVTVIALTATTAITITPSTIPSTGTTSIGFSVAGSGGGPTPTGSVALFYGSQNLGSLPLLNGSVAGTVGPLNTGTYAFYGVYSGDSIYASSQSAPSTLTVTGVTLTPSALTLTGSAGTAVTESVTVNSVMFTGAQALGCTVAYTGGAATSTPTCSFNPASVTFTGSGTMTSTLTISSTAPHAVSGGTFALNRTLGFTGLGGGALCLLLTGLLPTRRRRALQALRLISAVFFLAATLTSVTGCSGASSSSTPTGGTTKGSYDVTISANSNLGGANNVGSSTHIALTIQ